MAALPVAAHPGRSFAGKLAASLLARRKAAKGKPGAISAFIAAARQHVVTCAALGAFDMGGFQVRIAHLGTGPGWIAVCVSLIALDFAVRG